MNFKSKKGREEYFQHLIKVYLSNCNKFDALLQDLDKPTLKYLILYMISNDKTLPEMNLNIFIRLCLDCL